MTLHVERRVKLATDLPEPPELTDEDLDRLADEGRRLARIVEEDTRNMDRLTGEDLAIWLR